MGDARTELVAPNLDASASAADLATCAIISMRYVRRCEDVNNTLAHVQSNQVQLRFSTQLWGRAVVCESEGIESIEFVKRLCYELR